MAPPTSSKAQAKRRRRPKKTTRRNAPNAYSDDKHSALYPWHTDITRHKNAYYSYLAASFSLIAAVIGASTIGVSPALLHTAADWADRHIAPDAALVMHILYNCQTFATLALFETNKRRNVVGHAASCLFWPIVAAFAGSIVDDVANMRGTPLARVAARQWGIVLATWAAHHAVVAPALRRASKRTATAWRAFVLYGEAHAKSTSCLKAFRAWATTSAVALYVSGAPIPRLLLASPPSSVRLLPVPAAALIWCGLRGSASTWVKAVHDALRARSLNSLTRGGYESARYAALALAFAACTAPFLASSPSSSSKGYAADAASVLWLRTYLSILYVGKR